MRSDLAIAIVRDATGLAALEHQWWSLWSRSARATPFQSPAWLISWWRAFHPGELLTVAVYIGDCLIGLAPLYMEAGEPDRRRILPLGISISDYLDVLAYPEHESAVAAAIVGALGRCAGDATIEIPDLAAGALAAKLDLAGVDRHATDACPVLELPPDTRSLADLIPSRRHRKLRMARNRLSRAGPSVIMANPDLGCEDWLLHLHRLHALRWSARGETGVLTDARLAGFHADVLPQFVARDLARLFALRIEETIVGIYYGFQHRSRAYAYLGGFDPAFAYYSPGSILMAHAIEQASRDGAREFHFLRGAEHYKYEWGATDRWNQHLVFELAAQ